jgi:hypothetical protein
VTGKIAALPACRVHEVGISYARLTYEEGQKVGWRDGLQAAWCIWKYRRAAGRPLFVRLAFDRLTGRCSFPSRWRASRRTLWRLPFSRKPGPPQFAVPQGGMAA